MPLMESGLKWKINFSDVMRPTSLALCPQWCVKTSERQLWIPLGQKPAEFPSALGDLLTFSLAGSCFDGRVTQQVWLTGLRVGLGMGGVYLGGGVHAAGSRFCVAVLGRSIHGMSYRFIERLFFSSLKFSSFKWLWHTLYMSLWLSLITNSCWFMLYKSGNRRCKSRKSGVFFYYAFIPEHITNSYFIFWQTISCMNRQWGCGLKYLTFKIFILGMYGFTWVMNM